MHRKSLQRSERNITAVYNLLTFNFAVDELGPTGITLSNVVIISLYLNIDLSSAQTVQTA